MYPCTLLLLTGILDALELWKAHGTEAELLSAEVFKHLCGTATPTDWKSTWTLDLVVLNSL